LGRRPLGAILHSSNEPGELSQWLCHDDSTINIVVVIIIIIFFLYFLYPIIIIIIFFFLNLLLLLLLLPLQNSFGSGLSVCAALRNR